MVSIFSRNRVNRVFQLSCWMGTALLLGGLAACQRGPSTATAIQAGNITILDTRTDLTDRARAKQNVEDTLIRYPDINCLVGLWSYNGPAILSAVKDANKQGQVPIVCFDEEEDTLQGIADGAIHATVVQPRYLEPLPLWELERFRGRQPIVVEQSATGQFAALLREKAGIEPRAPAAKPNVWMKKPRGAASTVVTSR